MMIDLSPVFVQTVFSEALEKASRKMTGTCGVSDVQLDGVLKPSEELETPPAAVCIKIGRRWMTYPPEVFSPVKWLCPVFASQDQDLCNWHRFSNRKLCWIKPDEWQSICGKMDSPDLAIRAAYQLVRNVRVLLQAHWIAYSYRIEKWPDGWLQNPHKTPEEERKRNG